MDMEKLNVLTEVARECFVHDNPKLPLKALAAELGKAYTTLIRELNPDDDGAKLGADSLLPMMRATGDIRILEWLADRMGYTLIKKSDIVPDRSSWQAEHVQDTGDLGEMARMMDAGAPPSDVYRQCRKACENIQETAAQYEKDFIKTR